MKISDILLIVIFLIILTLGIVGYFYNKKGGKKGDETDENEGKQRSYLTHSRHFISKKSKQEILDDIRKKLLNVINARINYNYDIEPKEEKLLEPNYEFIVNNFINDSLQIYDVDELRELVYKNPFDFISSIPDLSSKLDKLTSELQITAMHDLIDQYPDLKDYSIVFNYIKKNKDIFPISTPTFKNHKVYYSKEQEKVLKDFHAYLSKYLNDIKKREKNK
jgi:hypothetical protein